MPMDRNGGADLVSINRGSNDVSVLMNRNDGPVGVETNVPRTTALTLHPVSPNPFVDQASVMFELARAGETTTWDGRADDGHRVAAGVYLVRLQSGDEAQTQRVIFTR
jgi:hypothetical protein